MDVCSIFINSCIVVFLGLKKKQRWFSTIFYLFVYKNFSCMCPTPFVLLPSIPFVLCRFILYIRNQGVGMRSWWGKAVASYRTYSSKRIIRCTCCSPETFFLGLLLIILILCIELFRLTEKTYEISHKF